MSAVSDDSRPFPPARATLWRLKHRQLSLPPRPLLMGIVNVTPDSFSDGGSYLDPQAAINHGLQLAAQGADILDVGGESTRPYSDPVALDEELRRVVPVVFQLAEQSGLPVSIDTSKAAVAREAIAAGAEIINDVTALAGDPEMPAVARDAEAGVCAMHMQGTPRTMQDRPDYQNVVEEVLAYLRQHRDALVAAGIDPRRIALDPGIGFGKTHQHNLALLSQCYRFHELGCPLLLGPSRKGFIAKVLGDKQTDRTAGAIGVALSLASQGVQMIRMHEVQQTREAMLLFEATRQACGERGA